MVMAVFIKKISCLGLGDADYGPTIGVVVGPSDCGVPAAAGITGILGDVVHVDQALSGGNRGDGVDTHLKSSFGGGIVKSDHFALHGAIATIDAWDSSDRSADGVAGRSAGRGATSGGRSVCRGC